MDDDGWAIASHIALSSLMSLFPFLIFVTALGAFLGTKNLADEVAKRLVVAIEAVEKQYGPVALGIVEIADANMVNAPAVLMTADFSYIMEQIGEFGGRPDLAAGLGQPAMDIPPDEDPRLRLVDWMADKTNPFFAKSLVNRYWKHFFKRGLVEPEDDLRDTNPPTNPDLFEALAKSFTESGYDLKALVRTLTQSHAYQLSSTPNPYNAVDRQAYSHYYPRRMTAEVMLDSIDMVTGSKTDFADLPAGTRAISLPDNSYTRASPFLKVFGRPDNTSVCECERVSSASLAQSLHLLNAADIQTQLSRGNGRADMLTKDVRPDDDKITDLYHIALSRDPNAAEVKFAHTHLDKKTAGKTGDEAFKGKKEAYEDILWALLNTKEFLFNH